MTEANPIYLRHIYSVGSVADISHGKLDGLTTSLTDAQNELLTKTSYSVISAPNVIGAYMIALRNHSFENVVPRSKLEMLDVEELKDLFGEKSLISDLGITPHPFLVQIGYDPKVMPAEIIGPFLEDFTSRIKVLPYDGMNTESEQMKEYLSAIEFLTKDREENPDESDEDFSNAYLSTLQELMEFGGLDQESELLLAIKDDLGMNPFNDSFM